MKIKIFALIAFAVVIVTAAGEAKDRAMSDEKLDLRLFKRETEAKAKAIRETEAKAEAKAEAIREAEAKAEAKVEAKAEVMSEEKSDLRLFKRAASKKKCAALGAGCTDHSWGPFKKVECCEPNLCQKPQIDCYSAMGCGGTCTAPVGVENNNKRAMREEKSNLRQ